MRLYLNIVILLTIILSGCSREWDEPLLIAYDDSTYIYIMDEYGYNVKQIAIGINPSFSPNGEHIVYWRANSFYTMNIMTKKEKLLVTASGYNFSTWSPDGSKIAFIDVGKLYTINADGTNKTPINNINSQDHDQITWSSDSKIIACINNLFNQIVYFNLVDGTRTEVFAAVAPSISFSPIGDAIAYTVDPFLYIAKTDFTTIITLTNISDKNPSWSPDGSRLVYESIAGEIRIINSTGGTYTQISGAGYHHPSFQCKPR